MYMQEQNCIGFELRGKDREKVSHFFPIKHDEMLQTRHQFNTRVIHTSSGYVRPRYCLSTSRNLVAEISYQRSSLCPTDMMSNPIFQS